MEPSDFQNTRSPRRELQLQGPRPAPLKVRKDSYKIRKPPVPPQQQQQQQYHQNPRPQQQQQQIRPPVIIYTVSPKVIHTNPSEFMTLVQRLTGSGSGSSSSANQDQHHQSGAISPAARLASIEKTKLEREKKQREEKEQEQLSGFVEGIENIERSNLFPGILSPGPTSLPVISPNFFSPPSDPNMINMFHDLSPVMHGNRNFIEGSFMPSPSTSFISPRFFTSSSPNTPSVDLFNNFFYY